MLVVKSLDCTIVRASNGRLEEIRFLRAERRTLRISYRPMPSASLSGTPIEIKHSMKRNHALSSPGSKNLMDVKCMIRCKK
jgi:hypothetical protein